MCFPLLYVSLSYSHQTIAKDEKPSSVFDVKPTASTNIFSPKCQNVNFAVGAPYKHCLTPPAAP